MIPRAIASLGLTSLCLGGASCYLSIQAKAQDVSERCDPVGRVVQVANSSLPIGQPLCREDKIRLSANQKLKFACYSSGREITLAQGTADIDDHCEAASHRYRRCTNQIKTGCIISRNPEVSTRATLFVPYSSTVLGGRPRFNWEAYPSANLYSVELFLGKKRLWKQTTQSNSIPYPSTVQPLEQGKAYLIKVSAYRGNRALNRNVSVLNRVSADKLSILESTISSIDTLPISAVDKILDQERIYFSQGLLSESIEILKSQLEQDPFNPVFHRLMGDRFMNAGLPHQARPYFAEAKILANKKQDMSELAKANEGLAEIAALPNQPSSPTPD